MGEALYEALIGEANGAACRVYAPVGGHRDLLAYLVRRLLENGANSSFVSVAADPAVPVAEILRRPQQWIADASHARHPRIPLAARPLCAGAARIPQASSSATARACEALLASVGEGGAAGCAGRCADRRRGAQGHRARRPLADRRQDDRTGVGGGRGDRRGGGRRRRAGFRRLGGAAGRRSAPRRSNATADLYEQNRDACSRCCSTRAARRSTMRSPKCARRSTSAATTRRKRDGRLAPERMPGPDRRNQRAAPSRPRRVRLHQPVEFSARDLHRPDRRRAGRRQCRRRQAGRADAADRERRRGADACRRHRAVGAATRAGRRQDRRRAGRRSARRGRRLHGLDRGRAARSIARSPPRTGRSCR